MMIKALEKSQKFKLYSYYKKWKYNHNKKIIKGNNIVKNEGNEKQINIKDNIRKISDNSSNNNIFKTKKIEQIKTNLNKKKSI